MKAGGVIRASDASRISASMKAGGSIRASDSAPQARVFRTPSSSRARANAVAQAEARAARLLGELLAAEGVEDAEGAIAECHCDEDAAEEDHPRAGLPVLAEKATMSAPMAPIRVPSPEQARMMPV